MDELLIDRRADGVALLTLNRPDKRNALNSALRSGLISALGELTDDGSCKVVVVTGAGGDFCAGFDLEELMSGDAPAIFAESARYHRALHTFAKPTIAAVAGRALAGGFDLALLCDLRVAGPDARLGQPQVRRGIPAAFDLVRSVTSDAVARDLCLTGRQIDAAEALRLGVVHRVSENALGAALELANDLATLPANAMSAAKARIVAAQPNLWGAS